MLRRYVHGTGSDDPVASFDGPDLTRPRHLFTDHQGSIVAITDGAGSVLALNAYDAWGIPNANNAGTFGYTGQAWIPELGMWHYKARVYSPTLGRFMQTDPVGYDDQVNLYAYVGNDPVNVVDPSGEDRVTCNVTVERDGDFTARCTVTPDDEDETNVEYNVVRHNDDGSTNRWTERQEYGASLSREGITDHIINAFPFVDSFPQMVRDGIDRNISGLVHRNVSVMNGRAESNTSSLSGHGGRPSNNFSQNRSFRQAANAEGLDARQREALRQEVEDRNRNGGENLGYHQIREIARRIKTGIGEE